MKIHKTQNLNSNDKLGIPVLKSTDNIKHSSNEFRLNGLAMRKQALMYNQDKYESYSDMAFGAKRELVKEPIKSAKKSISKKVANSKFVKSQQDINDGLITIEPLEYFSLSFDVK